MREYSETSDGVFFSDDEQFNQLKQFIDARENTEASASVNNNEDAMSEEKEEGKRDVKEVNGLENVTVNDANRKEDASVNNNNKDSEDSEAVMSEEMRDETGEVETELKETKNGSKEIEDASVNNKGNDAIVRGCCRSVC